ENNNIMTSIFSSYLHAILPGLQDLKQVRSGDMKLTWKSVDLRRRIEIWCGKKPWNLVERSKLQGS
ncbi:hypothetical protein, partial [Acinetobacter baumannii]|uniref:hypothetical protein n=1 Tax=Acinetobacter baumannii TaxID=470 RepID=UPI0033319B37